MWRKGLHSADECSCSSLPAPRSGALWGCRLLGAALLLPSPAHPTPAAARHRRSTASPRGSQLPASLPSLAPRAPPPPPSFAPAVAAPLQLLHQLSTGEQAAVRRFVDRVEAAWGVRFAPGFDPGLRFMAHVWEPLRWVGQGGRWRRRRPGLVGDGW
jgi:hypothetical protein